MSERYAHRPVLARHVLRWAADRLGTPELAEDAADLFTRKSGRSGERAARRWYRRQALGALGTVVSSWLAALGASWLVPSWARGGPGASLAPGRRGSTISTLDFKLGLRMLVRHPGLTVVAGLTMAFAIAVGAGTFQFLKDALYPTLPVAAGERVVRIQDVDAQRAGRAAIRPVDFQAWRAALHSVEQVGAFHRVTQNLWPGDGEGEAVPVDGIAVSATAFGIAGVAPLLGRPLVSEDERTGAPAVAVLSFHLWQSRFGSDPGIIGRVIRLGDVRTTVVGVVPEGFAFPVPADLYAPLGLDALAARARAGEAVPGVIGFGRLAPHATLEGARAELATLATAAAGASPVARQHVTPVIEPFAYPLITTSGILTNVLFAAAALFLGMLMIVVCANVALLLFARAATRESEIVVRTALGASRGRIVAQLFVEALVLAGVATVAGLWAASAGLRWALALVNSDPKGGLPFWIGDTLSPTTVGWAVLLAVVGAAVAGMIPALQVTGRGLQARLQQGAGRGSGIRLGRLWTAVVVGQVALTVIFMPVVFLMGSQFRMLRSAESGVAAEQYLVARVEVEDAARAAGVREELRSRLGAESWVRGVTMADGIWPGWRRDRPLEVEGLPSPEGRTAERTAQHLAVDPDFFEVLDARLIAGRLLSAGDLEGDRHVVVVNESFVQVVLGGRNAVGRQIRIGGMAAGDGVPADEAGTWYEIVGVVRDLGLNPHVDLPHQGTIFHPLRLRDATHFTVTARVAGDPGSFATRLRSLALQVDPTLRLEEPRPLAYLMDRPVVEAGAWFRVIITAGALALLLTLAGIYAVMAFTVARRTREIGVRVALGAGPRQVAIEILTRAARHVGYGVLAGGTVIPILLFAVSRVVSPAPVWPPLVQTAALLGGYLAVMMGVCLLACVVPMARALRVQPTEALAGDA